MAASSHDRNNHPERHYIASAIDVHTTFLHAHIAQELFPEAREETKLWEDEVWKLHTALYGYRKAPNLWHQHVVSLLESLNDHPHLTDPNCFRNDELDINIFIHVDDGLLFGPSIEFLRLVELLSNQVMMRVKGRMERLGDHIFFLGRVIVGKVGANPKYIRDVIAMLGLEDSRPVTTPSVKRKPTTESIFELENEASRVQDRRGC